jgi:hypothetical protein
MRALEALQNLESVELSGVRASFAARHLRYLHAEKCDVLKCSVELYALQILNLRGAAFPFFLNYSASMRSLLHLDLSYADVYLADATKRCVLDLPNVRTLYLKGLDYCEEFSTLSLIALQTLSLKNARQLRRIFVARFLENLNVRKCAELETIVNDTFVRTLEK